MCTKSVSWHQTGSTNAPEGPTQQCPVKYSIPIKHLLLDNGSLGKISKEQLAAGVPVWHTSLHNPDWAAYAELCGATGIRVDSSDELDDAFARLFASEGPALMCVHQDAQLI